ncbi:hypothetical protein AB4254_11820 [Vibrio breoganii]
MTYTLEQILDHAEFGKKIEDLGAVKSFVSWYDTTVYCKHLEHEARTVERMLNRYERFAMKHRNYHNLAGLEDEWLELVIPNTGRYYTMTPDACNQCAVRLSVFSATDGILSHEEFDDRDSALWRAASLGCVEAKPGSVDALVTSEGFARSLVIYEAQKRGMSLDQYILKTNNQEHRLLYKDRIVVLKELEKRTKMSEMGICK